MKLQHKNFDLFKLHVPLEDNGPRSFVKFRGKFLPTYIKKIVDEILLSNQENITSLSKRISVQMHLHHDTVLKMLQDRSSNQWISIPIILELLDEWKLRCNKTLLELENMKAELQSSVEQLNCGFHEDHAINAVRSLDATLAKIAGAHLADGHLLKEITKRGCSYKLIVIDEYKSNLEAFASWAFEVFGVVVALRKAQSKAHQVSIRNKMIGRYLEIFLGFPCGKKTYFNTPPIIAQSPENIQKAFLLGVLSFDGSVETDKTVSYGIANETLRDEVYDLLHKLSLPTVKQKKQGNYHLKTGVLDDNSLKRWIMLFEPNTEKHLKLKEMLEGFSGKVSSFENAATVFKKVYKKCPANSIQLCDVLVALRELEVCDKYILSQRLGTGVSTLYRYIHLLENANILVKTTRPNRIVLSHFHPDYVRIHLKRAFLDKLFLDLKQKGFLRKEFALHLGVCESSVNNWARYRHNLPLHILNQLLKISSVSLSESDILGLNRLAFVYNPNIKEWRVPHRSHLARYYL